MAPDEYRRDVPEEDIVQEICDALDGLEQNSPDEYLYYYYFLTENKCGEGCRFCGVSYMANETYEWDREQQEEMSMCCLTALIKSVDKNGKLFIFASGEDYSSRYYPKFCPECRRALCE